MSTEAVNVTTETIPNIYHARCLSSRSWEERLFSYRNIGALLAHRASSTPDKNFLSCLIDKGVKVSFTYSQFYDRARQFAAYLQNEIGIGEGDRIATLMTNDAQTVLTYFAAWLLGGVVVPINPAEDDDLAAYILMNSEVKAVFTLDKQYERAEGLNSALSESVRFIRMDRGGETDAEILLLQPLELLPNLSPDTECLIVYTSGTTGAPKGVVLEQANLLADAHSIAEWHQFSTDDRAMCILPIHHVNGTVVTLMTPLYSGGSIILNKRFHANSFWQTLADEKCTWVSVVPTVLAFLLERGDDLSQLNLSHFRHIVCGAGPLTTELASRFHAKFGIRVVHGYGLSETTCYSSFLPIDLNEQEYQRWMFDCGFPSIGCPISANDMTIQDAEGNTLSENERGEIVIRGQNVMKYYFKRPDVNLDTFKHGWFRSGDEGFYRMGEDGREYFFITGRLKELIIRGGVNYSPFDIDEVLNAVPGIKAAMAVGFENDFYGEEVGAYVQLESDSTLSEAEILAACRKELPYAKCPKVVVLGETFPVTSTGKYQRIKLKPLFVEWKVKQFREKQ